MESKENLIIDVIAMDNAAQSAALMAMSQQERFLAFWAVICANADGCDVGGVENPEAA